MKEVESSSNEVYDNVPINLNSINIQATNMFTIYNFNTVYDCSSIFGGNSTLSKIVPNDEKRGRQHIKITKDINNYVGDDINEENILEIYFNVEDKMIYIESEAGKKFGEIINDLYDKYGWLEKRNIVDYELNGKKLDKNLTAQQNNITNKENINIIIG